MSRKDFMMKSKMNISLQTLALLVSLLIMTVGCETAHQAAYEGGRVVGEGINIGSGVTEGAADAIKGKDAADENPYGR